MPDIDDVIAAVQRVVPGVRCDQLTVTHPADDDGIWFFRFPNGGNEVQIESSLGNCPFLVEHSLTNERFEGATVDVVAEKVVQWLDP